MKLNLDTEEPSILMMKKPKKDKKMDKCLDFINKKEYKIVYQPNNTLVMKMKLKSKNLTKNKKNPLKTKNLK